LSGEQRHPALRRLRTATARGKVEEQIFDVGLTGFLSSVFPDRLNSQQKDGNCEISLYFQT
jgi:hypothetical protein